MDSNKFQHKMDLLIQKYALRFLPPGLTPNHLTLLRLALVPLVYTLLTRDTLVFGFFLFIVAAATDALDGALARTSNQITDFGKLMDPIADKLLIGSVFLYIGTEYFIVKIFIGVIILEILAVVTSAIAHRVIGRPLGANTYGKIKMVLQTLAVVIFIAGFGLAEEEWIIASEWVLFGALFFALLSALEQTRLKIIEIRRK